MKKLTSLLILSFISTALASECPKLTGTYHCSFIDGTYSPLKIKQSSGTDAVTYLMTYTNFGYDPEELKASLKGEADSLGWITKCSQSKLLSVTVDGSMYGEIYLDSQGAFVRKFNGNVMQTCPVAHD